METFQSLIKELEIAGARSSQSDGGQAFGENVGEGGTSQSFLSPSPARQNQNRPLDSISQTVDDLPKYTPTGPRDMSISHSLVWKRPAVAPEPDDAEFKRKKLKLSDLPISGAQRATIDGLLLTFKKSGEFDKLRKSIFAQFESSVRD